MTRAHAADEAVLVDRLALVTAGSRLGRRAAAVLSIEVHARHRAVEPTETITAEALRRIRECLERVDTVSVVGPLQFLVLLERVQEGAFAIHVADRVVQAIRAPFRVDGRTLELIASVGVSTFPEDGDETAELLRRATSAREGARAGGGDLVGFCSGRANVGAQRRLALERALVGVLERGELSLHYQPQIDTQLDTMVGVEALLRWNHAALGPVSPAEFIPILEAGELIRSVGAWVLRTACRQAAEWAGAGKALRVGVNVSARQLEVAGFERLVFDALDESGLDPSALELELTESVLVANPTETRAMLEALRRRGVRIALDDFGTGYASLAYIRRFPMDTLKIDREFVRGLPADPGAAAITSSIIALAHSLHLELVAEGVESEAEEDFLHAQSCYVVQGFRHARPMPAADFARWRRERPWL